MTREEYNMTFEQAQEYISKRGLDIPWNDCDVFIDSDYLTESVGNVLKWADEHPHWISVEDELPPTSDKDDESDDYLIVDSDGDKNVGYYNKMDELWFSCDGYILDVTHWMPLPQPPKKGD